MTTKVNKKNLRFGDLVTFINPTKPDALFSGNPFYFKSQTAHHIYLVDACDVRNKKEYPFEWIVDADAVEIVRLHPNVLRPMTK